MISSLPYHFIAKSKCVMEFAICIWALGDYREAWSIRRASVEFAAKPWPTLELELKKEYFESSDDQNLQKLNDDRGIRTLALSN